MIALNPSLPGEENPSDQASSSPPPSPPQEESLPQSEPRRRAGRPRVVGIYGARSAGKTCYLTVALLGRSASPCGTVLLDDSSRSFLEEYWKDLEQGSWPTATPLVLNPIKGQLIANLEEPANPVAPMPAATSANTSESPAAAPAPASQHGPRRQRYPFETKDYGGRLAERGPTGSPQLTEEFHQWLEGADGLLFFLAVDQLRAPQEAQERLREVDALLNRLVEKSPAGHALRKPIAILVTKWDQVSDLTGTAEQERQKLLEFMRSQGGELAQQICQKIEAAGERVRLFPVSASGGHSDGKPALPLRPYHLHEPLVWLFQQIDQCLVAEAEQKVRQALERVWPDYTGALRVIRTVVDEYGIQGPAAERLTKQTGVLRQRRLCRRIGLATVGWALLLMFWAYFTHYWDRYQYLTLRDLLHMSKEQDYSVLKERANHYLSGSNLWAGLLGHKTDIDALWQGYNAKLENEFQALRQREEKCSKQDNDIEGWKDLEERCCNFNKSYPESPYKDQIAGIQEKAQLKQEVIAYCRNARDLADRLKKAIDDPHMHIQEVFQLRKQLKELEEKRTEKMMASPCVQDIIEKNKDLYSSVAQMEQKAQKIEENTKKDLDLMVQMAQLLERTSPWNLDEAEKQAKQLEKKRKEILATDIRRFVSTGLQQRLDQEYKKFNDFCAAKKRLKDDFISEASELEKVVESICNPVSGEVDIEELSKYAAKIEKQVKKWEKRERPVTCKEIDEKVNSLKEKKEIIERLKGQCSEFDKQYTEFEKKIKGADKEQDKISLIKKFLETYGGCPGRGEKINKLKQEHKELLSAIHDRNWREIQSKRGEILKDIQQGGGKIESLRDKTIELLKQIENYKECEEPAPLYPNEAQKIAEEIIKEFDKCWWQSIEKYAADNPQSFNNILERAHQYIEFVREMKKWNYCLDYEQKVRELMGKTLERGWGDQYRVFWESARGIDSVASLANSMKKARDLIEWLDHKKQMDVELPKSIPEQLRAVQGWLAWGKKLRQKRHHSIKFDKVQLPRALIDYWICLTPNIKDGQGNNLNVPWAGNKRWFWQDEQRNIIWYQKGDSFDYGPVNFSNPPGMQDYSVDIEIEIYRRFLPNVKAVSATIPVLQLFCKDRGKISITVPDWGNVDIDISSETLTPPRLPNPD
jgi:hypothetical protein